MKHTGRTRCTHIDTNTDKNLAPFPNLQSCALIIAKFIAKNGKTYCRMTVFVVHAVARIRWQHCSHTMASTIKLQPNVTTNDAVSSVSRLCLGSFFGFVTFAKSSFYIFVGVDVFRRLTNSRTPGSRCVKWKSVWKAQSCWYDWTSIDWPKEQLSICRRN